MERLLLCVADEFGPQLEVERGPLRRELSDVESERAIERQELLESNDDVEQVGVVVDAESGRDLHNGGGCHQR